LDAFVTGRARATDATPAYTGAARWVAGIGEGVAQDTVRAGLSFARGGRAGSGAVRSIGAVIGALARTSEGNQGLASHAGVARRGPTMNADLKGLMPELTRLLDNKGVDWRERIGRCLGRAVPRGELADFLGVDIVTALWKSEPPPGWVEIARVLVGALAMVLVVLSLVLQAAFAGALWRQFERHL